ncbi:Hypothetical protein, putative [Bodo saltans]|uniref:Uncharacterized protein n=1 Tax=Bodo saltans TaxID=75058 RepID=A0A0S4J098_BODSA|nr:Hypothetical protein, putative [Bodo saltans]|eukprot:CUF96490.1 Hypothetical protein, putative [Bodo saltans]
MMNSVTRQQRETSPIPHLVGRGAPRAFRLDWYQ